MWFLSFCTAVSHLPKVEGVEQRLCLRSNLMASSLEIPRLVQRLTLEAASNLWMAELTYVLLIGDVHDEAY